MEELSIISKLFHLVLMSFTLFFTKFFEKNTLSIDDISSLARLLWQVWAGEPALETVMIKACQNCVQRRLQYRRRPKSSKAHFVHKKMSLLFYWPLSTYFNCFLEQSNLHINLPCQRARCRARSRTDPWARSCRWAGCTAPWPWWLSRPAGSWSCRPWRWWGASGASWTWWPGRRKKGKWWNFIIRWGLEII